jgi:hypothetical protein
MQNDAKKLFDLAAVDLLYADFEVKFTEQPNDAVRRIAHHLDELRRHLTELERIFEGADASGGKTDGNQRLSA